MGQSTSVVAVLVVAMLAGCILTHVQMTKNNNELFKIDAETVECEGVGPMRCLVVNSELFYYSIEGYTHMEGVAAEIYVEKRMHDGQVPSDAGLYSYRVVPGQN